MAKKRKNPPAASSSDEDEVDSSAGKEEKKDNTVSSSSEGEEELPVKAPSSSSVKNVILDKTDDADSEFETETDSDSDTEQLPNHQSDKTILAPAKSKKEKSPTPSKSGTKHPSEEGPSKMTNSKRVKKDEEKKSGEDSKKPAAFQRLWTEEDEITVLQGMIDFKNDTGNSPYDDTNAYYDFIKKFISFEVSKLQFMDKLRSLKKKYMGKEKPSFTKPHDQKSYRLCKFIWGPDGICLDTANGVSKKKNKKVDSVKQIDGDDDQRVLVLGEDVDEQSDWFENSFLVKWVVGFGVDELYVKQSWRLVPAENKKKVEDMVKMLQAKEIESVLLKTEILHEVTSMIAEASKNTTH